MAFQSEISQGNVKTGVLSKMDTSRLDSISHYKYLNINTWVLPFKKRIITIALKSIDHLFFKLTSFGIIYQSELNTREIHIGWHE